ncbi:hypothetical protein ACFQDG_02765 [Natronoarchaeum mannanilyticum]|uniref:Uncharacterized protein n=1 Tax=Natronoarchaeum mannanilyticum TaxID=926360 RepID=A0AAV3TCS0_9EURY
MEPGVADGGWDVAEKSGAITIGGLGLVLGAVGIEFVLSDPEPLAWWSFEFGVAAALPAVLMYAGYWLARTDFDADELWSVTAWSFAGVVALTTVGGWLFVHQTAEGTHVTDPGYLLVTLATVGALGGLTAGVARAGSIGGGVTRISADSVRTPSTDEDSAASRAEDDNPPRDDDAGSDEVAAGDDDAARDDDAASDAWVGLPSMPVEERAAEDVDLEDVVAGEQRRIAVEYLTSTPGRTLTVHQLVDLIVERRGAKTGDRPDREPIVRRLHCIDLPKLAAAGLIERDEHGRIRYVGGQEETARLASLVEAIDAVDGGGDDDTPVDF